MLIGIIRNRLQSDPYRPIEENSKVYLLSMLCHFNGVESFFFYEDEVDLETKTIKGLFFDDKKREFVERETVYPDIVDNDCTVRWKDPAVFKSLFSQCAFVYTRRLDKEKTNSIIQKSACAKHALKTYSYKLEELDKHLLTHKALIIKPIDGSKGSGIYKLSLNLPKNTKVGAKSIANMRSLFGKKFLIETGFNKEKISNKKFLAEYAPKLEGKMHIAQEYVNSTTIDGAPFDIRAELRRGDEGEWEFIRTYVKVGNKRGIVSNVAKGGFVTLGTRQFLMMEFGTERGVSLYKQIKTLAKKVGPIVQSAVLNFVPTITIDIGINRDDKNALKIFEINTGAATSNVFSLMTETKTRVDCFKYMFKNKARLLEHQGRFEIDEGDACLFGVAGVEFDESEGESASSMREMKWMGGGVTKAVYEGMEDSTNDKFIKAFKNNNRAYDEDIDDEDDYEAPDENEQDLAPNTTAVNAD